MEQEHRDARAAVVARIEAAIGAEPGAQFVVHSPFGVAGHSVCDELDRGGASVIRVCAGSAPGLLPAQTLRECWDPFAAHGADVPTSEPAQAAEALAEAIETFAARGGTLVAWCHLQNADTATRHALAAVIRARVGRRPAWVLGTSYADARLAKLTPEARTIDLEHGHSSILDDAASDLPELQDVLAAAALCEDHDAAFVARALDVPIAQVNRIHDRLEAECLCTEAGRPQPWLTKQALTELGSHRADRLRVAVAEELLERDPASAARLLVEARQHLHGPTREHAHALLDTAVRADRHTDAIAILEALAVDAPRDEAAGLAAARARSLLWVGNDADAPRGSAALFAGASNEGRHEAAETAGWLAWSEGDLASARAHFETAASLLDDPAHLTGELELLASLETGDRGAFERSVNTLAAEHTDLSFARVGPAVARFGLGMAAGDEAVCGDVVRELRGSASLEIRTAGLFLEIAQFAFGGRFMAAQHVLDEAFAPEGSLEDHWLARPSLLAAARAYVATGTDLEAVAKLLSVLPSPPPAVESLPPLPKLLAWVAWTRGATVLERDSDRERLAAATLRLLEHLPLAATVFEEDLVDAGADPADLKAKYGNITRPQTNWRQARAALRNSRVKPGSVSENDLRSALDTFVALGAPVEARAVRRLLRSHQPARADYSRADADHLIGSLSPRQVQIARLAAAGASNKEIAARLGISANTVRNHLAAAFQELGVSSRGELAGVSDLHEHPAQRR